MAPSFQKKENNFYFSPLFIGTCLNGIFSEKTKSSLFKVGTRVHGGIRIWPEPFKFMFIQHSSFSPLTYEYSFPNRKPHKCLNPKLVNRFDFFLLSVFLPYPYCIQLALIPFHVLKEMKYFVWIKNNNVFEKINLEIREKWIVFNGSVYSDRATRA